jgi:hypothetical protein
MPLAEYLKECIASAVSIIAIFDLFCLSFGHSQVVLSLAYSVYTAASIFLLEIQANPNHIDRTLRKMAFCLNALDLIKSFTPGKTHEMYLRANVLLNYCAVIDHALEIILRSLNKYDSVIAKTLAKTICDAAATSRADGHLDLAHSPTSSDPTLSLVQPIGRLEGALNPLSDFSIHLNIDSTSLNAFSKLEPLSPSIADLRSV